MNLQGQQHLTHVYPPLALNDFINQLAIRQADINDTTGYIFDLPDTNGDGYKIWLPHALSVFEVMRRFTVNSKTRDECIFLLTKGIPFRTLRRLRPDLVGPEREIKPVACHLGQRPKGYQGDKYDYAAYEQIRLALLKRSWNIAAMSRGGLIWRLAIDSLGQEGIEEAAKGPSWFADLFGMSTQLEDATGHLDIYVYDELDDDD